MIYQILHDCYCHLELLPTIMASLPLQCTSNSFPSRALLRCCFLCCPVLFPPLGGETHLSDLSLNFTFPSILILQARLDYPNSFLKVCYSCPLQKPSVIMVVIYGSYSFNVQLPHCYELHESKDLTFLCSHCIPST